jgi:hypothetical protein
MKQINQKFLFAFLIIGVMFAVAWYFQNSPRKALVDRDPSKLTETKVKSVIGKWMDGGGSVDIVGIQELSESATVQLTLNGFHYKGRRGYSSEIVPKVYSGPASAEFVHYNDGRWVLQKVTVGQGMDAVWFDNLNLGAE